MTETNASCSIPASCLSSCISNDIFRSDTITKVKKEENLVNFLPKQC